MAENLSLACNNFRIVPLVFYCLGMIILMRILVVGVRVKKIRYAINFFENYYDTVTRWNL